MTTLNVRRACERGSFRTRRGAAGRQSAPLHISAPPRAKPSPPAQIVSWDDVDATLGSERCEQRNHLTFAATIAHALSYLGKRIMPRTVIWIVGACEEVEGQLIRNGDLAEPLAAMCPSLGRLEIWLIGPDMRENWRIERGCSQRGASIVVRALSGTLHAVNAAGNQSDWPNYVVLFSSGIGTLAWPLVDTWLPTLTQLIQLNIPLLFTCYDEHEAAGQMTLLKEAFDATVSHAPIENPLSHESTHRFIMWVQGTSMRSRLQAGIQRGRAFLKTCTMESAPRDLEKWVRGLASVMEFPDGQCTE
jgi:hypothetical protein